MPDVLVTGGSSLEGLAASLIRRFSGSGDVAALAAPSSEAMSTSTGA